MINKYFIYTRKKEKQSLKKITKQFEILSDKDKNSAYSY